MSDHDDRQAQYVFSNAYHRAVRPDRKTGYIEGTLPDAYDGVSTTVMRVVWRCYADHANYEDGANSWPSYALISQLTGCSRRQVQRAVAALTETGWLIKVRETTKTTSACYTVSTRGIVTTSPHDTLSPDNTSPHDKVSTHEVTPRHLGIATTSPGYSHGGSLPYQEPYQEPVVEDAREDDDATNSPPQVVKDTKKPSRLERAKELLATNDTEDMARGIYLIAKSCSYKLNEGDCSTIAFSLQFAEYSVEEIIQYVAEKIGYHHDKPSNLLTSFITKDASVWLLESRERARAIGVYDGPTYRRMELPDEPEEVKAPEPELTEEQKQKIRDDFDRMMREGIDPFAVRMSQ